MITVGPARLFIVQCGKNINFSVAIFSDTMNVKKCQTLYDGSTHGALPVHTFFSDLKHISRPQECQSILIEHFMFSSD